MKIVLKVVHLILYTCSNLAASKGKYYAEFKLTRVANSTMVGITDGNKYTYLGNSGNKDACLFHDGNFYPGNSSFGNSFTDNDICGVAMDLDNMKVYFSKNGTWQNSGDPTSGSTGTGAATIPTGGLGQFHVHLEIQVVMTLLVIIIILVMDILVQLLYLQHKTQMME